MSIVTTTCYKFCVFCQDFCTSSDENLRQHLQQRHGLLSITATPPPPAPAPAAARDQEEEAAAILLSLPYHYQSERRMMRLLEGALKVEHDQTTNVVDKKGA